MNRRRTASVALIAPAVAGVVIVEALICMGLGGIERAASALFVLLIANVAFLPAIRSRAGP